MSTSCILALDQGTTSSRSILFDQDGQVLASAQQEFKQFYPRPGWVEHDPEDIWRTQFADCTEWSEKHDKRCVAGGPYELLYHCVVTNVGDGACNGDIISSSKHGDRRVCL